MNITMVGCGKLGLPCAEVMSLHHKVIGYDINPRESSHIEIIKDLPAALSGSDIIFVAVPTPHDEGYGGEKPSSSLPLKNFDYSIVVETLNKVNEHVTSEQLVVLISTVLPGTVRSELAGLITDAKFIYNPYLIAMGSVKWDMINPEMIIIGTEDGDETTDASVLIKFYSTLMENSPRIVVGTWDEAEAIKIFYNTFISAKVGLVNMIQDVAQRQGNINVDVVTNALSDSTQRIMGSKYMTAGMGDGGACHPRDNIALSWLADKLDLGYDLFNSIMQAREKQAENMANEILKYDMPVVIVGKAYKPNVPYTEGSSSMLVGWYIEGKQDVYYHDDTIGEYPPSDLGPAVYLLAHNDSVTYGTETTYHIKYPLGSIVIDPWRKHPLTPGVIVVHYGDTRR